MMSVAARRTVLALVAACAVLAMIIIAGGRNSTGVAHAASAVEVHVKQSSLTDQTCDEQVVSGGHFVINQITAPPSSITVVLSDGTSTPVPLSHQTSKVAQYTLSFATGLTIADATAWVPSGWSGQFVLSNYLCSTAPSSTPPPPSSSPPAE